jgi:hypothetical protein
MPTLPRMLVVADLQVGSLREVRFGTGFVKNGRPFLNTGCELRYP